MYISMYFTHTFTSDFQLKYQITKSDGYDIKYTLKSDVNFRLKYSGLRPTDEWDFFLRP